MSITCISFVQGGPKSCTFFNTPYLWNRSRQNETDFTKKKKRKKKKRKQEEEKKGYGGKDLQKSKVLSRELKSEWAMEW